MAVATVRLVHSVNAMSALVSGYVLNGLAIVLIVWRTPKEMRVYSRILLQTCVIDLLMLATTALVQPVKEHPSIYDHYFLVQNLDLLLRQWFELRYPERPDERPVESMEQYVQQFLDIYGRTQLFRFCRPVSVPLPRFEQVRPFIVSIIVIVYYMSMHCTILPICNI